MDDLLQKQQDILDLHKAGADPLAMRHALRDLFGMARYQVRGLQINSDPNIWYRVRAFQPGAAVSENITGLIYRADAPTECGRVNVIGRRVFYAAWNIATAISEVEDVPLGGRIQCIYARCRPGASYHATLIGALEQIHMSGKSMYPNAKLDAAIGSFFRDTPPGEVARQLLVDSFLADLLRKSDTSFYSITSNIAELMYASDPRCAFIYPSVRAHGAANIAVPDFAFDQCFEVVHARTFEITTSVPKFNIYEWREVSSSSSFGKDGAIDWTPTYLPPPWTVPKEVWSAPPDELRQQREHEDYLINHLELKPTGE